MRPLTVEGRERFARVVEQLAARGFAPQLIGASPLADGAIHEAAASLGAKLKTTDSDWIPYDDYYFTPEYSYARIETFDTFGLAAIDLLGEIVNAPRFDDRLFEKARG